MEKWDAYNANFEKIEDMVLLRGEKPQIPKGIYHLVCDVLVRHTDGSYLLMRRDEKKTHGGMWEASAGGSALVGEDPLQCAMRELKEETGIDAIALTEVGREFCDETHAVYVEFLCETEWDKQNITLQEGETMDFKWVSRDELCEMKPEELATWRMQKYVTF